MAHIVKPAWYDRVLLETYHIQSTANTMDGPNLPFLVAGSTAVAIYLYHLLTVDSHILTKKEYENGIELFTALKKPDDLDFKYKRYDALFYDHIHRSNKTNNRTTNSLKLDMSFLSSNCNDYIDLAGFRCCDPFEESPIFTPLPGTASIFSKIEFHAPREFRRKSMHHTSISNGEYTIQLLGINDLFLLYDNHTAGDNIDTPKIAALEFIIKMIKDAPEIARKYIGE